MMYEKETFDEERFFEKGRLTNNEFRDEGVVAKEEDDDFKRELQIDKYKLDQECLSHASRYAYYLEALSVAKSDAAAAKDAFEYIRAERSIAIRAMYEESGTRCTEAKLDAAITMDDSIQQARKKVRDAETVVGRLWVAVQAMDVRKSQLDNLVKLYCAGYYSTVSAAPNSENDINEQTSRDIRRSLNDKEKGND